MEDGLTIHHFVSVCEETCPPDFRDVWHSLWPWLGTETSCNGSRPGASISATTPPRWSTTGGERNGYSQRYTRRSGNPPVGLWGPDALFLLCFLLFPFSFSLFHLSVSSQIWARARAMGSFVWAVADSWLAASRAMVMTRPESKQSQTVNPSGRSFLFPFPFHQTSDISFVNQRPKSGGGRFSSFAGVRHAAAVPPGLSPGRMRSSAGAAPVPRRRRSLADRRRRRSPAGRGRGRGRSPEGQAPQGAVRICLRYWVLRLSG